MNEYRCFAGTFDLLAGLTTPWCVVAEQHALRRVAVLVSLSAALWLTVGCAADPGLSAASDDSVTPPVPVNVPPFPLLGDVPPVPLPSAVPSVQMPSDIPKVSLPSDVPLFELPAEIPQIALPSAIPPILFLWRKGSFPT